MSNLMTNMATLVRYKIANAALQAKHLNGFLESQLTQMSAPSGAQIPRVNMRLQSLLEREDVNLATVIRIVTGSLAWLPLKVMQIDQDENGKEVLTADSGHPFNDLWKEPNTWHTTSEINTHIGGSLLTTGNSFLALKTVQGRLLNQTGVTGIWPVPPWSMLVKRDESGMPTNYVQNSGTKWEVTFDLSEVVHHRLYNINDPIYGRSGLEPLKRQLLTEYHAELMQVAFFTADGTPRTVLAPEQSVTPQQAAQIEAFYKNRTDADTKQRLQILPVAGKIQRVTPSQTDMEFQEMRKYHRERTFGLLGIPPFLGGVMEFANYANALIQETSFWRHTMIPLSSLVADFLTRQLLWVVYPDGHRTKLQFDLSGVEALQVDKLKQAQKNFRLSGGKPIMTVNEIRSNEYGLEPIEGGDSLEPIARGGSQGSPENDPAAGSAEPKMVEIRTRNAAGDVTDRKMVDVNPQIQKLMAFDHQATEKEPIIRAGLKTFWKAQEKRIIERVRAVTVEGLAMSHLAPYIRTKVGDLDDFMDMALERQLMAQLFEPIILQIYSDIGDNEVSELRFLVDRGGIPAGIALEFDVDNPKVKGQIQEMVNRIAGTNSKTFKDIRAILKTGFDQRLSVDEVARMISGKFSQYNLQRAKTIARTEMTGIANGASNQVWFQNGATHKTWLATLDPVTRDYHVMYHGERALMNGFFVFGPEPMDFPGWYGATLAGNVINCRCTLEYDFDPLTALEIQELELQETNV